MIVAKVSRVANGKKRATRPRKVTRKTNVRRVPNTAHLLTLGFPAAMNHKRRSTVKKAHKKNSARRSSKNYKRSHSVKHMKKANTGYHKHHKKSRNPQFFGSHVTPVRVGEYVLAGLVGVAVNRAILAVLPATITSNNLYATLAAGAIAIGQWWLGSMLSKDLGSAFGFGGLMNASSQALNAFIPSVGSQLSLSGRIGDFVPAQYTIPPQPAGIGNLNGYVN